MANTYSYQPLNESRSEIRLLEIVSIHGDSKVKCQLHTVSLEDQPQFSALSYVWGDPTVTKEIELDGQPFHVTVNLANALQHVGYHWQSQYQTREIINFRLWADAVCINQANLDERSSQVQLMRNIYSNAELVLSWIGSGVQEMNTAMDILATISKETSISYQKKPESWQTRIPDLSWLEKYPSWNKKVEGMDNMWFQVKSFMELPYWQRIWIFQEVVLAKTVLYIYESNHISHGDMVRAVEWFASLYTASTEDRLQKPLNLLSDVWFYLSINFIDWARVLHIDAWREIIKKNDIRQLESRWQIFEPGPLCASDPRDYIYGLLGLFDCGIIPDYKKDLNTVLQDLIRAWMMKDGQALDWLRYAGAGIFKVSSTQSLPSWAPNYSLYSQKQGDSKSYFYRGSADQGIFEAVSATPNLTGFTFRITALIGPTVVLNHENNSLSSIEALHKFILKIISGRTAVNEIQLLKTIFEVIARENGIKAAHGLTIAFYQALLEFPHSKTRDEETIKAMIASKAGRFGIVYTNDPLAKIFQIFFPGLPLNQEELMRKYSDESIQEDTIIFSSRAFASLLVHFQFAELEHDYLGVIPKFSRPGDVMAILKGFNVPVVLRKCENNFILLGTCDIPGLMKGEAKELLSNGMARIEEIQIR